MFFAITALGVSAIQIALGIAIGLALRRQRQRRLNAETDASLTDTLPVDWCEDEPDENPAADATASPAGQTEAMLGRTSAAKPAPQGVQAVTFSPADQPVALARCEAKGPATKPRTDVVEKMGQRNRRKAPRRSFQYRQQVAPYHGGTLPGKASFREVECQDISSTGFSFLSSQLPDFDSIVVALGVAPRQVHLWAQIVSRVPLSDGAAPLYRIGCRFVGTVNQ